MTLQTTQTVQSRARAASAAFQDTLLPQAQAEATSKAFIPEPPATNRDAQSIFDQVRALARSRSPQSGTEYDAFDFKDGDIERKRYFRLGANNQLEEYSPLSTKDGSRPEHGWTPNTQLFVYYYAAGKLYSSKGDLVGDMGINSAARNAGAHQFLHTHGTLQDGDGRIWNYDSRTLTLNGAPAIIRMCPPPDTHQTYRHSTKAILADAPDQSTFEPKYNDRAYELVYSKNPQREQRAAAQPDIESIFSGKSKGLTLTCENGRTIPLRVTRIEGSYAYLANEDGLERIRIKREPA